MPTPTPAGDREPLDVLVIGAGQAGLALGHHLAARGADFLLLDAGPEIGHSWRSRWDSLRSFITGLAGNVGGETQVATVLVQQKYQNFEQETAYSVAFMLVFAAVLCLVVVALLRPKEGTEK